MRPIPLFVFSFLPPNTHRENWSVHKGGDSMSRTADSPLTLDFERKLKKCVNDTGPGAMETSPYAAIIQLCDCEQVT